MRRRKLISTLGSGFIFGLTGCLETIGLQNSSDPSKNMKIQSIKEDNLKTDLIDINVESIVSESNDSNPLQVSIKIENNRNRGLYIDGTKGEIFGSQNSNDNSVILITPNSWDSDMVNSDCWKLDKIYRPADISQNTYIRPKSSNEVVYNIIGNKDNCLQKGDYRFETYYSLRDEGQPKGSFITRFGWGFNLRINNR